MNFFNGLVNPIIPQSASNTADLKGIQVSAWAYENMTLGRTTWSSNTFIDSGMMLPMENSIAKVAEAKRNGTGFVSMQTEYPAFRGYQLDFLNSKFNGGTVRSHVATKPPKYPTHEVRLREFVIGRDVQIDTQERQFTMLKNNAFMSKIRASISTILHTAVRQSQHYMANVISNACAHIFAPMVSSMDGKTFFMLPYFTELSDKFWTLFNTNSNKTAFRRADGINAEATIGAKEVIGLMHQFLKRSANPDIGLAPIFANPSFTKYGTGVNNYLPRTNEYLVDRYERRGENVNINTFEVIQTETLFADRSRLFRYGTKPNVYDNGYVIPQFDKDGTLISGTNAVIKLVKVFKPILPSYAPKDLVGFLLDIVGSPATLPTTLCIAQHDWFAEASGNLETISTQDYDNAISIPYTFTVLKETLEFFPEAQVTSGLQSFIPDESWLIRAVDTTKLADKGVPSAGTKFVVLARKPKLPKKYIPNPLSSTEHPLDGSEGKGEIKCLRDFKSNINPAQIYNQGGEVVYDDSAQVEPTLYDACFDGNDTIELEMLELMLRGTTAIDNTKFASLAPLANNRECVISYKPEHFAIFPCPAEQITSIANYNSILDGNTSSLIEYQGSEVSNTSALYGTAQTYLHPSQTSHMIRIECALSAGMPRYNMNCVLAAHSPSVNTLIYNFNNTVPSVAREGSMLQEDLREVNPTVSRKRA